MRHHNIRFTRLIPLLLGLSLLGAGSAMSATAAATATGAPPAGWHLVKVLDVLDARYENFDDAETHKRTLRMYLKEQLDQYVVELRQNQFEVVVYDDELTRRFQKEADLIAELNKKAVQEGSVTKQRQEEMQKWMVIPPQD